jgi:hypothetical protein
MEAVALVQIKSLPILQQLEELGYLKKKNLPKI